jgi:hypothetical protein
MVHRHRETICDEGLNDHSTHRTRRAHNSNPASPSLSQNHPYIVQQCPRSGRPTVGDWDVQAIGQSLATPTHHRAQAPQTNRGDIARQCDCLNHPIDGTLLVAE